VHRVDIGFGYTLILELLGEVDTFERAEADWVKKLIENGCSGNCRFRVHGDVEIVNVAAASEQPERKGANQKEDAAIDWLEANC
jgi:hypothetical protein